MCSPCQARGSAYRRGCRHHQERPPAEVLEKVLSTEVEGALLSHRHFKLTPEVGGQFKTVIDKATRKAFREQWREGGCESHAAYAADALVALTSGGPGSEKAAGHTTHVVVDLETLKRGDALPGETCALPGVGPVNAKWVRGILGEAFVTAIIKHGKDITTVSHLGRHIPAELRTAMIVSGRECCIEGCGCRDYLELDHCEVDFSKGGPTAWWNLEWFCSPDHDRKTQGWLLSPPDPVTGKRTLTAPGASRAA